MAVFITGVTVTEFRQTPKIRRATNDLAGLIAADHSWWLAEVLFTFAHNLLLREQIERRRKTRSQTLKQLDDARKKVVALESEITTISDFSSVSLNDLSAAIRTLNFAVCEARQSASLINARGHVVLGPVKALAPGNLPTKFYYAALIAELHAFFHDGKDPSPGSNMVASWAQALLEASDYGNRKDRSWGNNRNKGWRGYFAQVSRPELKEWRNEVRKTLVYSPARYC